MEEEKELKEKLETVLNKFNLKDSVINMFLEDCDGKVNCHISICAKYEE
jgi:hypothetical protein